MFRPFVVFCLAVGLASAGCGGGNTTTVTVTAPSTTSAADPADDASKIVDELELSSATVDIANAKVVLAKFCLNVLEGSKYDVAESNTAADTVIRLARKYPESQYDPTGDGGMSMSQMLGDTAASLDVCDPTMSKRFENASVTVGR